MTDVFTGACGAACVSIPVEELTDADVIDSHDDLRHEVEAVSVNDDGRVVVNVRRTDGSHYSTEFAPGSTVAILAYQ